MITLSAIAADMAASQALKWAWRNKWWILGGAGTLALLGYIGVLNWKVDHYRTRSADALLAVENAERINGQLVDALSELERERELAEKALSDRLARKSSEARRLGDLVQHVLSQEKTNACAASPSIRAVLDGLRHPEARP